MSDPKVEAARRRRGFHRGSLTRLVKKLTELESRTSDPTAQNTAKQLQKNLENTDTEFKRQHLALLDLLETPEDLEKEQTIFEEFEANLDDCLARISRVISSSTSTGVSGPDPHFIATKRIRRLDSSISATKNEIKKLEETPGDICIIQQYEEQVIEFKRDLTDITKSLIALGIDDSDPLMELQAVLNTTLFDHSLRLKRIHSVVKSSSPPDGRSIRLPKIDVPSFDGNLLAWKTFWEQFTVAIHTRSDLSKAEKLVYLRQSVRGGTARAVIEGLSRTGDDYDEAVECLENRYDRPRLIHQTHVKKIIDIPPIKNGSGKELRYLHDVAQQHLRALKSMGSQPSGPFVTSILELKLDPGTMFEWQRHSSESTDVPHYEKLLDFINLRAQASEHNMAEGNKKVHDDARKKFVNKPTPTHPSHVSITDSCVVCKTNSHLLFSCGKFKALSHEAKMAAVRANNLCMNCLRTGHFVKQCKSVHKCRECQRPHHTLLHADSKEDAKTKTPTDKSVSSNTATKTNCNSLLMTCKVMVTSPSGHSTEARALLDSGSSACFVSNSLSKRLHLPRSSQSVTISGIAGITHSRSNHATTTFHISSMHRPRRQIEVSAIIVPQVTCNLPVHSIATSPLWKHLQGLTLADPKFDRSGVIDLLLGVDVFIATLLHGRRQGPPGTPFALETEFGWVLAGNIDPLSTSQVTSYHATVTTGDEILQRFWQLEETPPESQALSSEEAAVVKQFKENHYRSSNGRFVVPLPKRSKALPLGESRAQAVRRFLSLEKSLHTKKQFDKFAEVMEEYFSLGHAEQVPVIDLQKSPERVFYLPMHAVYKATSATTKTRVVFDGSSRSSSGVSLNEILMVGPTVHSTLVDVLLRFRLHQVALVADITKMYRAVELDPIDKDYHRFVWRSNPQSPLLDYRMNRLTFGVSASSFAANMSVLQNAVDFATEHTIAANAVRQCMYVDDCLTGAETVENAITLQTDLQELFNKGCFTLRKWNSSHTAALENVSPELRESHFSQKITDSSEYSKTLGIEWSSEKDVFRLTVNKKMPDQPLTKRMLTSDIAKTFDILGWFSPSIIKAKILLQKIWQRGIGWDELVPLDLLNTWHRWRSEMQLLSDRRLPRCYCSKSIQECKAELHGFSDASEDAYSCVIYLRTQDSDDSVEVSIVMAKTRVAPLKRQTIPRLELCGALLLSKVLTHVIGVLNLDCAVYAWTDSTVVLGWLNGEPRSFKVFVGNRVAQIIEHIPPEKWRHVSGTDNPADCASRGIFPSDLIDHPLWWSGPTWLSQDQSCWPQSNLPTSDAPEEKQELCLVTNVMPESKLIDLERYSSYSKLRRIIAWVVRFVRNCKSSNTRKSGPLTTDELSKADVVLLSLAQTDDFRSEIQALEKKKSLPRSSPLRTLHPIIDTTTGLLRVGGRVHNSSFSYSQRHPVVLHSRHPLTKLIIRAEHVRLLHAGPTLTSSSLASRFHIIGQRRAVRTITRACVTCRRTMARPQPQIMGQLPIERMTPGLVFERTGIDYAGPVYLKLGRVRRPVLVKAYIGIFVSFSVKAVHIELISDLTSAAFIACLRRFVARRGKPISLHSDHGSNFVGATRELADLAEFLEKQRKSGEVSDFCTSQGIQWVYIPERAPHFGGLWESAVKSVKTHLRKILGQARLTFEEYSTVLAQVEACLNSRPLVPLVSDDDGIEALTPGHFLIGRPLEALPDPPSTFASKSYLRRWNLCQTLTRHFWKRWSTDYFASLRKFNKWHNLSTNLKINDLVLLKEDGIIPARWPLGRIVTVHPGRDNQVRVVTVKTATGIYRRPIVKIALLLKDCEN